MNKRLVSAAAVLLSCFLLFSSPISFYGGKTSVSLEDGSRTVRLTERAGVSAEDIVLDADEIFLYGEDFRFVRCTGNVSVNDSGRGISLTGSSVFYDRQEKILLSDGWVELEDEKNDAHVSGARIEYDENSSVITIQMRASIEQNTDKGLLKCSSDVISYNSDAQTLVLSGNASVVWGDDSYRAQTISVNIETEEIELSGSITGELHG